jgi:CheY-like chemotaxis protein
VLLEERPDFDLVLSDIVMPGGMSGVDLAHSVRQRFPHLPVILTTGYSEAATRAAEDGLIILRKPYGAEALAEAVGHCMACAQRRGHGPLDCRGCTVARAAGRR